MSFPLNVSADNALIVNPIKPVKSGVVQTTSVEVSTSSDPESPSLSSKPGADMKAAASEVAPNGTEKAAEATALKILHVIETYGLAFERTGRWDGLETFIPMVKKQVERREPVRLLLPGFPFKSPNAKDKVLGTLPDLGEELALSHLNGLCDNIASVYEHGAEVHICSDGLVYNDLLSVPDETVWNYGEAIRAIAVTRELRHLKFIRLWDLLEHAGTWDKNYYLTHSSCIRRELLYRYGDREFEADMAAKSNEDIRMTLASYIKYLGKDLAHHPKYSALDPEERDAEFQDIAKQMMCRWKAFAGAIEANRSDLVRLSIHDSAGKGKLSMSLIPQGKGVLGYTPWHSCIVVELDGSYRTVHAADITDAYELVENDGRPFCYRAKSELFDWKDSGLDVTFEHLYPCGLIVHPVVSEGSSAPSMRAIPMRTVRSLSNTFAPVILRGFSETKDEELYLSKGYELGEVQKWIGGEICKAVDTGETDKNPNNIPSDRAIPMQYDGCVKFEYHEDPLSGEKVGSLDPPGYQYFTCISTAPKGAGYTLFCNSRLFFRYLPPPWSVERLERVTWQMENEGFWGNKQTGLPLVKRHPVTNAPCLRWHQPWSETKVSNYKVTIENDEQELVDIVNRFVCDYRVCYRSTWNEGDLLVNDNVSVLFTRTSYEAKCDREIWRIHVD